jgi:quinol monooxygenase YgiN
MKRTFFVAVAGLCAAALPILCQQQYPLRSVTRTVVKPDRGAEFVDIAKQTVEMIKKAGNDRFNVVWQVAAGNSNEYWSVSPMSKYGDRDQPPAWFKSVPQGAMTSLFARRANCVTSNATTIERYRDDLSTAPATATSNAPPPAYLRVLRTRVRQGKAEEYATLMKNMLLPALKKAGVTDYRVRQVAWGGNRNDFTSTTGFQKWSEMDGPGVVQKALGEEGFRQYVAKVNELVTGTEYIILRYRPELSYLPESR